MKSLFCLLLTTCAVLAQPSNILVIIADDLGADSFPLTATGGTQAPMPNLTALKNSGVLFTNAHAQPTCSPTRATMLTGRHPFRTGIGAQLTGATSPQLSTSEFTLPEAFAANPGLGYSLAMFGKWHLNSGAGTNDTPRTVGGWPHFAGTIIGALPDYSAWTKITNNVSAATTTYATTDTANDVIAFIQAQPSGTPWFAWAAFNAPHAPLHVPPANLHSYGTPATNRGMYEAMCEAFDTEVGRILAVVNLTDTHVIFIGDNGTPSNVIQAPYNAAHSKETIYQGGTRVPLIIAGPSVVSPNRDSSVPVHAVDLYSTILELAGISVAATQPATNALDSRSLTPILQNSSESRRMVMSQMFSAELATSVSGRVITDAAGYTLLQFDDGHEELFHVPTDANQGTNLLGTNVTNAQQTAYAALKLQSASYSASGALDEPLISSWQTANSGQYARIFPTLADLNSNTTATTWTRGQGTQATPAYSDVHQVDYSTSWVYVHSTGLASHIMGPWYLNAAKTNLFPNYPANQAVKWRFPRTPVIPTTKVNTGLGATGRMVNGVSLFDCRDAFSYSTANAADATPGGSFTGDGIWNRDAYHNESVTFDPAYAHQAGSNYHYHAQPIALRYQLGDHVDFNPTTNLYTENTAPVTKHSPIVAWAQDGLPVYGPYGYSTAMDAGSGVRRMISGFALRDGSNGTAAITVRQVLPAWAARVQNRTAALAANQYGPAVGANFLLGHYIEDYEYLGDLGQTLGTHFDLNEQNVRFCVTPEFPGGTWAYFTPIQADGTPVFPYTTGRQFYGDPIGGAVTTISEPVSTAVLAGPLKPDQDHTLGINSGNVTLTWSGVEGGIYQIQASPDLTTWTALTPNVTASGADLVSATETAAATANPRRFYQTTRTALATYDRNGIAGTYFTSTAPVGGGDNTVTPGAGGRGTTVAVVIQLPTPLPPANVGVSSITFGSGTGVTVNSIVRYSQTLITANFVIAAGATTGARNVIVTYNGGVTRTITNGFTVN
ncbi:MAG: sulfatase-like hydrolase/transferase [Prosthecobacter sp.]|jgi:arylsulfatase A-like enzyme|uniref:sulfatase-like hydrolase/transferase n=1 Tax=Prosthecobacter sp. TaxID=1965333 RepID=UPI0019EF29F3|nr:sulfatase-like hydrolase/transferase [Prosthecobacter sp.]MBE2287402.1 sulfatase-like hydrolase/transferase [Prosthecobacter sp.]